MSTCRYLGEEEVTIVGEPRKIDWDDLLDALPSPPPPPPPDPK
jgi:hypothetical protein